MVQVPVGVPRPVRTGTPVRASILAGALQSQLGGLLSCSAAPTLAFSTFSPFSIPVRTYLQTTLTLAAGHRVFVVPCPWSHSPLLVVTNTNNTKNHRLYHDTTQLEHDDSWTSTSQTSTSGLHYANVGGFNPFTAGGHPSQVGVFYNYKGGTMTVEVATSYDAMATLVASGTDENPRLHGRRSEREDAVLIIEHSAGGLVPYRYHSATTAGDYYDQLETRIMSGSDRAYAHLPIPATQAGWFQMDDQTDAQSNSISLHKGNGSQAVGYGAPVFLAHNSSSAGTVNVIIKLTLDYAVVIDNTSILATAGVPLQRTMNGADRTLGGFSSFGNTPKEAMDTSVNRSLRHSVSMGALTPGEASVLKRVADKTPTSMNNYNGVHAQKSDSGFVNHIISNLKAEGTQLLDRASSMLGQKVTAKAENFIAGLFEREAASVAGEVMMV